MAEALEMVKIFNLLSKLDRLATQRATAEYVACFSADGQITGREGNVTGQENLKNFVTTTWQKEPAGTVHITANQEILTLTENTAEAESILMLANAQGTIFQVDRIYHKLVKVNGQWLVRERVVR